MTITKINVQELALWANLIYEYTGIVIGEGKSYLVENRLSELLTETGCTTFSELYYKCRYAQDDRLRRKVIERISTQETSFFRDPQVYKALQSVIRLDLVPARLAQANPRETPRLRIWSAACSTGQEPYSLAMTLCDVMPDVDRWFVTLLATDLADNAFRKASLGRYSQLEVARGLDQVHLEKYFTPMPDNLWQVKDRVRAMISFRKVNLVADDFRSLGTFDLVLCRNVAIYFDKATKETLFQKISQVLAPDGFLLAGVTEAVSQVSPLFRPVVRYGTTLYARQ